MIRWTQLNTEGFSDKDLEAMNEAAEIVFRNAGDDSDLCEQTVNDMIGQEWMPGVSGERIAAKVCKRLGID